jgi:hypothetical protein
MHTDYNSYVVIIIIIILLLLLLLLLLNLARCAYAAKVVSKHLAILAIEAASLNHTS